MAKRGWSRGQGCAVLAMVGAVLLGGTACSADLDRAQGLDTRLAGVAGVDDAGLRAATTQRSNLVRVTLDLGLDAAATLATVRRVDRVARDAGFDSYVLEVSRTITGGDVLVVDQTFATSRDAERTLENWIRVLDALLGEVTYEFEPGNEVIEVISGGGIAHDVAEASRIGSGTAATTWRFEADTSAYVVSGEVTRRDVTLFNRVQRSVASTVLPVPATRWELQRRTGHVILDLEVTLAGGTDPRRITREDWAPSVRPLAVAAVRSTRYPASPRWIQLSDVAGVGRDTFAQWESDGRPVRGRDRHSRGWDLWWVRVAQALR